MDDVIAVMDAAVGAGSRSRHARGRADGRAVRRHHPDRVSALVLYATFARATWAPGYQWAWKAEERQLAMDQAVEHWGEGLVAGSVAPSLLDDRDFMEWAGRLERLAASPATIKRIFDLIGEFDVRDILPSIRVPTLVLHRRDDSFIDLEHSRFMAERIPDARLVELEGGDNFVLDRRQRGPARRDRGVPHGRAAPARVRPHARHGAVHGHLRLDRARGAAGRPQLALLLERHDALFRRALERHRGREVKRTGDGFLATFDGPGAGDPLRRRSDRRGRPIGIEVTGRAAHRRAAR